MGKVSFRDMNAAIVAERDRCPIDAADWYWRLMPKLGQHEFLDSIEAPHARLLHEVTTDTITPGHLAGPCTLKPDIGAGGIGVMVLHPDADGQWRDYRAARRMDFAGITALMRFVLADRRWWPDRWIVEELMSPAAGQDVLSEYSMYVFAGKRVELIRATRVNAAQKRQRWFTGDWCDVDTPVIPEELCPTDLTIPAPVDPVTVVDLAARVASSIPWPFARVDIYDASCGPRVGEVNVTDGNCTVFNPDWDERIGNVMAAASKPVRRRRPATRRRSS